jgi:nicotinamidase/pyrazinamidase
MMQIVVCGQALSHCGNYTLRDIADHFVDKSRLFLLKDGSSPVVGFEEAGYQCIKDMRLAGVNITTTKELFHLIRGEKLLN